MLYYSFVEFVMIYSLYFVFHYLFGGRLKKKKKTWYCIYKPKDILSKIKNSYKISRNKLKILASHISRNLIRFLIKLNITIIIFSSISIAKHHIMKFRCRW